MDNGNTEIPILLVDTIGENDNRRVTTREWSTYIDILSLTNNDWEGVRILDVGSGIKTSDPALVFPGATIYAIDPEFTFPIKNSDKIQCNTADVVRKGTVLEMPADSNSFDYVWSSHAIPIRINKDNIPKAISEMIRVLKPRGEIRLAPCDSIDLKSVQEPLDQA